MGWTSVQDKKKLLTSFNPKDSLWVVSDIKSRDFVREYIRKHKSISSPPPEKTSDPVKSNSWQKSVQRAQDFWIKSLFLARPELTVLSRSQLTFIYQEWAKSLPLEWQRGRETGSLLCQYMEMTAHLLEHPLKESLIEEWQSEKRIKNISKWQSLAGKFWSYLSTQQIIEESWISAFLIDRFPHSHFKLKTIVFDLGFEMNPVEAELISQIADKIPTTVLAPLIHHNKKAPTPFPLSYKTFMRQKIQAPPQKKKAPSPPILEIKKWTTPLAEVKDISAYVSDLLQKGVPSHKISVIAPRIEDYWIFLKSHFEKEKVPVQKSETASLISFYETQLRLSTMWAHLSVIRYENMEPLFVIQNPYQNFSRLKSHFYHVTDLKAYPPDLYNKDLLRDKNQPITADTFIKWASALLGLLNREEPDKQSTFKWEQKYLQDFALISKKIKTGLPYASWLKLLESFLRKTEVVIQKENPKGVHCLSFNALSYLEADFVYIAGLSESNLKTGFSSLLSSASADFLNQSLGFAIKWEPVDKMEQMMSHFIGQDRKDMVLSFSAHDFEGIPLNPSFLWLKTAKEQGQNIQLFSAPQNTSGEKRQQESTLQNILHPLGFSPDRIALIQQSIEEDQGKKTPPSLCPNQVDTVTTSLLEDYAECPFIFFTKKHFDLWDGPEQDMDMSPLERGLLIHKLFEMLLTLPKKKKITKHDISEILDKLAIEQNLFFESDKGEQEYETPPRLHPLIWEKEKSRLLKKALLFLNKERKNQELFTGWTPLACEKTYSCFWNLKTQSLEQKGDIAFKGKIDRIDSNQQAYHIIDYKGQLPVGAPAVSWSDKAQFQLAVYAQVVQQGLADLPALPVLSALYLSYKDFTVQGMALKTPDYIQLLGGPRKKSLISEEQKKAVFQEVNQKIQKVILNMQEGKFPAHPKTKKLCETCRWQKMCRAPHLNY